MAEREPLNTPERESVPEQLAEIAAERLQQIENAVETGGANQAERVEVAREKLEKQPEIDSQKAEAKAHATSGLDRRLNYSHTLTSLQRHLKPASRAFSKFIHTPVVERTSEVVGSTVLRPSVTLGATLTALIIGVFFYATARHYGFGLTGSEMVFSLLIGGVIGVIVELFYHFIKGFRR